MLTAGALKDNASGQRYLRSSQAAHVCFVGQETLEQIAVDGNQFIQHDPLKVDLGRQVFDIEISGKHVTISLTDAHWAGLDEYLRSLREFRVAKSTHLPSRATERSAMPYHVILSGDQGQQMVQLACEALANEVASDVLCANETTGGSFLAARSTFQSVFEHLERLDKPQSASPSQPNQSSAVAQ